MTGSGTVDGDRSRRLDAAIAEYLRLAERSEAPPERDWLDRHPDLADGLAEFFADRERMERWAKPDAPLPPEARPGRGGRDGTPTLLLREPDRRPAGTVLRHFGDYELLAEVARGGMGVVYKARQVSLNRVVALKMILSGHLASAEDVRRFRTEAEAAAHLDHPGIVPIHEVGEADGQHYFTMKLVEGGSLASRRDEFSVAASADAGDAKARAERAARLVAGLADAVAYAHQRGVIHRDLKPGNVLLDEAGNPYVTDFGLAKRSGDPGQTQTGAVLGTPSYMAPEQAGGGRDTVTTLADVYSLGAILYELLAGRPPFRGETPMETIRQVLDTEPVPPGRFAAYVDRDLETVCLKCLTKDPAGRYRTAQDLADELRRWIAGEPLVARPPSAGKAAWTWLRKNVRAAAWTLLIGVFAGAAWNVSQIRLLWLHFVTNPGRAYEALPSLPAPWFATTWQPPEWASSLVALTGLAIFLTVIGLGNYFLTRPKDAWSDAAAGLMTGLITGFFMFSLGSGAELIWARHDLRYRVGNDLWILQNAFERAARSPDYGLAPGPEGRRTITMIYPDLATDPAPENALREKVAADLHVGVLTGLVAGSFLCLAIGLTVGATQSLAAGRAFRGDGGVTSAVARYLELALGSQALVITSIELAVGRARLDAATVAGLLLAGLAVGGVLGGFRWYWRWCAYAAWAAVMIAWNVLPF